MRFTARLRLAFQLPRTEEPSGTGRCGRGKVADLRVSTSPDGRTIRNQTSTNWLRPVVRPWFQLPRTEEPSGTRSARSRWTRRMSRFNFPGRKNHPEPQQSPGRSQASAPCFNFPGRKNHPERRSAWPDQEAVPMFQLPRTEEPSGTGFGWQFDDCRPHKFQLPRTEEPSGTRWAVGPADDDLQVSTSPDGRTIRNPTLSAEPFCRPAWFQLPRTEEPSGTRGPSPHSPGPLMMFQLPRTEEPSGTARSRLLEGGRGCFNFPGRKNHPERTGASRGCRWSWLVSTSPDGRTIRNGGCGAGPAGGLHGFNFPGRKNHPEQTAMGHQPGQGESFNFPGRKNHPEHRDPVFDLRQPLDVSTSPDGRTIRNRSPQKATGGL